MKEIRAPKLQPLVINDPKDVALKWTGEKPMSGGKSKRSTPERSTRKKKGRKTTKQKSIHVPNEEGLKRISQKLGMSEAAVMNLGLAMVLREFDR
jgi:hypothetical protein